MFGLFAGEQVQIHFHARAVFAHAGFEAAGVEVYVGGVVADGADAVGAGEVHGAFVVEFLRDDDVAWLPKKCCGRAARSLACGCLRSRG